MKMTRWKYVAMTSGLLLAASVLLGSAGAGQGGSASPKGGPDVRVVNTQSEPVPVTLQGTTQIDTSTPIPVKDVDRQVRQPVQFSLYIPGNDSYTVPAGKQLVIEFVSGGFGTKSSEISSIGEAILSVSPGPLEVNHAFAGTVTAYENGAPFPYRFVYGQMCRIYASAGSNVSLRGGFLLGSMSISGYLVDAP
jgi:hypothetical protein